MLDATERRALTLSVFVAACLCFAPGQVVSGGFLLLVSILLWRWDARQLARESAGHDAGASAPAPARGSEEPEGR